MVCFLIRLFGAAVLGASCWISLTPPASVASDGDAALHSRRLTEAGLAPVRSAWICADEVSLRRDLEEFPQAERAFYKQRDKVRQMVREYDSLLSQVKQLKQKIEQNQQRVSAGGLNALEKQNLQDQNRRDARIHSKLLKRITEELNGSREDSSLTRAVVDLTGKQNRLTALILSARRRHAGLDAVYEKLREDEQLTESLRALGDGRQLGPAESYSKDMRRMDQTAKTVLTQKVPCYVRSKEIRLGAILNEETPATITLQQKENPTLIPASLAQTAGLTVPPDAMRVTLNYGKRRILLRKISIASIRIGGILLEDVEAYVMGPEGEDLGARLGPAALKDYSVQIDLARLTATFKAKSS